MDYSTLQIWSHQNNATIGITVANFASDIDTRLATITGTPQVVLIHLGSNDLSGELAEATWKNGYRTIISAVHTKWPSANIYLAKPVRLAGNPPNAPVAAVATMHGWIDDLVAEHPDYLAVGIDETHLENGDQYSTYFADVTHPNLAGYAQSAALWKTALGY